MSPHELINQWISDPARSFQAGYDLYTRYGRNRNIMLYLARKQNMEKLVYELGKLLLIPLKDEGVTSPASPVVAQIGVRKVDTPPQQHQYLAFEKVNPATLPADLQKVHAQIAEAYKFQRTYHEKLKLATTDELRAQLRAEVVRYDDIIAHGWDGIDAFTRSGEKVPARATAQTVLGISKQINACRSYITGGIKALPSLDAAKREKRIAEIKKRIDILIRLKAPVAAETKQSLVNLQIITGKSKLLIE